MLLTLQKSIIRPLQPLDAPSLTQAASSPAIARRLRNAFPQPYTLADAEWWITNNQPQPPKPLYNFALICPTTGRVMGCIGLVPGTDVYTRSMELGYWLGEEWWGKGVMSEAAPVFVRTAFGEFGDVERIWSGVFADNEGSRKVLERCGMRFEGRQRKAVWKNGGFVDQELYGVIREDLVD